VGRHFALLAVGLLSKTIVTGACAVTPVPVEITVASGENHPDRTKRD
jgi:hypothetical protein